MQNTELNDLEQDQTTETRSESTEVVEETPPEVQPEVQVAEAASSEAPSVPESSDPDLPSSPAPESGEDPASSTAEAVFEAEPIAEAVTTAEPTSEEPAEIAEVANTTEPETSVTNDVSAVATEVSEPVSETEPTQAAGTESTSEEVDPTAQHSESGDDDHAGDHTPNETGPHRLVAEVAAAPHKVYLLNRVRKAIASAGEGERAEQLKSVETEILAEVAARTSAKEQLCEKAEELKDSNA
jgi:hypothetical protein